MFDITAVVSTGGPLAALVAVLVWLVQAVASGRLVSGAEARRIADRDDRTIRDQRAQINALIEALRLPLAVVESLPRPDDTPDPEGGHP